MEFPVDFLSLMREHLGSEQAENLFRGLQEEPTISVRLNPLKTAHLQRSPVLSDPVLWCPDAFYLSERRAFTFDPLFHAGAYYVQDASSMYLSSVVRRYLHPRGPILALDLCAAPGGKSTLLASHLPEGSTLVSNEPIRKRAQVLAENMQKWGYKGCYVTQNYPEAFTRLQQVFHLIVADVPCSGEGMFRKDEQALREWSLDNVRQCVERQRDILRAALPALCGGGMLVYSTCTFNRFEDEEQVAWLAAEYGLEVLEERHFFPGRDRGEGLYMAALRKPSDATPESSDVQDPTPSASASSARLQRALRTLNVLADVSAYNESLSQVETRLELTYSQAIAYLRREAIHLAAPRGMLVVTYRGLPLGLAKSVGNRLNNLYPAEWRIRTTYSPTDPLPDFFV